MKILGIRNFSGGFRYAILEGDSLSFKCTNLTGENKVIMPKSVIGNDVYAWYKKEIYRILETHNINKLGIKRNENMRASTYSSLKDVMFFDCIATMAAIDKKIDVSSFLYSQLKLNSKTVEGYAESHVGKTSKYWDSKIADAISAAIKTF